MGLDEDNAEELLLPSTMTWMLDGSLDEAVSMSHPIEPLTGEPIRSRCNVAIKIRRNWVVYFVKQICMSLLVSTGGLLALLMQPSEMLGDRCAQLLVAILIIVTSFQSDLGLGNLSYLIWVDYFNVMQLVVLLMGLVQTMVIHRLMQVCSYTQSQTPHSQSVPSPLATTRQPTWSCLSDPCLAPGRGSATRPAPTTSSQSSIASFDASYL